MRMKLVKSLMELILTLMLIWTLTRYLICYIDKLIYWYKRNPLYWYYWCLCSSENFDLRQISSPSLWRKHNFPFVISKKFAKEYFIMFQNFPNSRLMIKSLLNPRLRVFLRKFQVLISVIFGECFILAAMQIFNFCEVMRLGFFLKLKINIQIAVPMSCKRIIKYFSKWEQHSESEFQCRSIL